MKEDINVEENLLSDHVSRGTAYELFVKQVYEAIIATDGICTIEVQHNIKLEGRSGCKHQIDVYWEFQVGGQTFRTAIECKAFDKTVQVGRVRDFYGVLADIPGLSGVFVTKKGYQQGAKLFGEHYGIALKEIRAPEEGDWDGRVRDIVMNFIVPDVRFRDLRPKFTPRAIADQTEEVIQTGFLSNQPIIFSPAGLPVASVNDLLGKASIPKDSAQNLSEHFSFPDHTFRVDQTELEISGVEVVYDVAIVTEQLVLKGDELITAIISDALTKDLSVMHSDGSVRKSRKS